MYGTKINQEKNNFFNTLMKNNIGYTTFKYNVVANNTLNKFKGLYNSLKRIGYDDKVIQSFFKNRRNLIDLLEISTPSKWQLGSAKSIFSKWYKEYYVPSKNFPNVPTNEPNTRPNNNGGQTIQESNEMPKSNKNQVMEKYRRGNYSKFPTILENKEINVGEYLMNNMNSMNNMNNMPQQGGNKQRGRKLKSKSKSKKNNKSKKLYNGGSKLKRKISQSKKKSKISKKQ
jgi:hypothetical protein